MRLDNSAAGTFVFCPQKYLERYLHELEPQRESDDLLFGSRLHALRQSYFLKLASGKGLETEPLLNPELEAEAQMTWAAYRAHWIKEDFRVVETERTRVVPLPGGRHELVVKMDAVVRNKFGVLQVNDLKTERRTSNNNSPETWAARPQISGYVYAARILYPSEKVSDEVLMDFIKRASPGKQKGPEFWRDSPRRNPQQIAEDCAYFNWIGDQIEECQRSGYWPKFGENCKRGNFRCDYYPLHIQNDEARERLVERYFRPAEQYLQIEESL